jgi:hypothetical protein
MPIPRKLASRMKLVALVTYTLFAVTQRISASSTNSIRKLAKTSRAGSLDPTSAAAAGLVGSAAGCPSGPAPACPTGWPLATVSVSAPVVSEIFPISTVPP